MANLFKDGCDPWFDPAHPMNQREPWRPTIDELERLLASDDDVELEILPNGEVRAKGTGKKQGVPKVLTMRDNLGGEYAASSKSRRRYTCHTHPLGLEGKHGGGL